MRYFIIVLCIVCSGCTLGAKKDMSAAGLPPVFKQGTGITVTESTASSLQNDGRAILKAMEEELSRSLKRLMMPDNMPPYFVSYTVKDMDETDINARYGSIYYDESRHYRILYDQVRVGNYTFDSSRSRDLGMDFDMTDQYDFYLPLDSNIDAIRNRFWLVTDQKYKEALSSYLRKKARNVYRPKKDEANDFSREKPSTYNGRDETMSFDHDLWTARMRRISGYVKKFPDILDSSVSLDMKKMTRYFVSSEGSRIVTNSINMSLYVTAKTKAEDGMPLDNYRIFSGPRPEDVGDEEKIMNETKDMIEELLALRKTPIMDPYTGPAILSPEVTGVFFHEVIGHRLEGERQKDEKEGMTFKDKVGQEIIPTFLSIIDDPTISDYGGKSLAGHYEYDDEGIPAQKVVLIDNGVLKSFLLSRTPIKGFVHSNGHGRNSTAEDPMARMGNLFVRSTQNIAPTDLKSKLLEECKKRGKPFGFYIRSVTGGETNTSKFGFQAFKGTPILVYKVYASNGREELVRGVEIVGTPLTSINNIIAAGNDYQVFNGYCGAESGFVPVSTIAPSVLVSEIELQRTGREKRKPPILPPPDFDE